MKNFLRHLVLNIIGSIVLFIIIPLYITNKILGKILWLFHNIIEDLTNMLIFLDKKFGG